LQAPDANSCAQRDAVVISVNPIAGARSAQPRIERAVELLTAKGYQVEIRSDLDEVAELANRRWAEGRLRALVGVGGDGTAAELVNRTAAGLPLAMLPAGNENLLARHVDWGRSAEELCRTISDGKLMRLDAGVANGRIFLLMLGCGFDADVVHRVHSRRKGHIRSRNYFKPILESIRSYEYPELRLHGDYRRRPGETDSAGQTLPAVVRWLFAFNLPCYGGNLKLAPKADGADGLLDICAFQRGSLASVLRYATAVVLRRHQRLADCFTARVRRLKITSDREVHYQLDGDPGGTLPVDIQVLPNRVTILAPGKG